MSLLNKSKVKALTLEVARKSRTHEFTRVSENWFTELEAALRSEIQKKIARAPSKGKTLQGEYLD